MKLLEIQGDAVYPSAEGTKIITHIVNNRGGWGKGFVLELTKRWPVDLKKGSPEWCYRGASNMELGDIQMVSVPETGLFVCNMCAQKDYRPLQHEKQLLNIPNLNYSSLYECLLRLRIECGNIGNPSIHMPPIGSGLAGGSWPKIAGIINQVFEATPYSVTVYRKD
jgi:O-acetyl-ADP-ribose deacetylase (regulator of RNase III)